MGRELNDYWVLIKYHLKLPFPLKNHFYKGKRIRALANWFCKDCHTIFFNDEWNNITNKNTTLSKLKNICPHCKSKRIVASTELSKAIIDKKSIEDIIQLVAIEDEENKQIANRNRARKQ